MIGMPAADVSQRRFGKLDSGRDGHISLWPSDPLPPQLREAIPVIQARNLVSAVAYTNNRQAGIMVPYAPPCNR